MRFWKDYVDGAAPYYDVPAHTLPDWQFNDPGFQMFPVFDLAVAGSGGGDPRGGTYPANMLIDYNIERHPRLETHYLTDKYHLQEFFYDYCM